eukprot:gene10615-12288_t
MQFCNVWNYCGDPSGCPVGDYGMYRQCWLKSMDFAPGADLEAKFTADGSASPGWISGFRASVPVPVPKRETMENARLMSPHAITAIMGVTPDVGGTVLDPRGDNNYQSSAEECCAKSTKTQFCNVWSYCSDPSGCPDGDYERYRQCWLKSMDFAAGADLEGEFKAAGKSAPGWISGFRASYIKTE